MLRLLVVALLSLAHLAEGGRRGGGRGKDGSEPIKGKGISRRKAKKQLEPPAFECALPDWGQPKPEELAEVDLGMEYCDWEVRDTAPTNEEFLEKYWQKRPVIVRNFTAAWPATERW